ncbi:MAG TPA: sensor domain-containing diguanylate cyclase [Methylotenera sp.]|nr:sensor domain-containing diguanylate cyclase [Methylotenera sp.]
MAKLDQVGEYMKCPIPANEISRLQAVYAYDILDTLPEVDFDTITRIASMALKVPAAVIGLMDSDRLWFKSQLGLGVTELDRQIAFCAHAIMAPNELLVVENMLEDERFQNNPLVTQAPNLRFYAGAPLINVQGYALGTIAVADTVPRRFTPQEGEILKDFSKLVVSTLEHRSKASQYQKLALTDQLTGLPNRSNFERTLDLQIAHSSRTGDPFSLFYMDLNQFKMVNDTYGHDSGDVVIKTLAEILQQNVRKADLPIRYGGEEFLVLLHNTTSEGALQVAQKIRTVFAAKKYQFGSDTVEKTLSIGISHFPSDADSIWKVIKFADLALYEAKHTGRNRVVEFEPRLFSGGDAF